MAINKPTKPFTFATGVAYSADVNENFDVSYAKVDEIIDELNASTGSKLTLAQRLAVSMNADGTMKVGITAGGEWLNPALTATYVDASNFTVETDQTAIYVATRRLRITLAAGAVIERVSSSTYAPGTGLTTVTMASAMLTDPITSVEHAVISIDGALGTVAATADTLVKRDGSGDIFGDLTGNVTGNVTGNLTGDVTGTVSGNAGTVTNGVYTTGNQTIAGVKTFSSPIVGSVTGNAGTVTGGVYTSRTISAGLGLTGGGDLSANRTISLVAGGVGSVYLATGTDERNWVLARTAGAAMGAVGTYAFLWTTTAISPGTDYAGSGLTCASIEADVTPTLYLGSSTAFVPSGTWKAMGGGALVGMAKLATLFLRIA